MAAADGGALEGRLRSAADRGDAGEVRTLLERGAPIDSRDGQGRTALRLATHGNHVEAARVLIDAGVNVDHVNRLGWTALLECDHARRRQRALCADRATARRRARERRSRGFERRDAAAACAAAR
ncbi:ankyrin repeat domain-containing protein [Burkholderia cepacia]|uniref:ankyrin repeat domain-containing protein n=1 Tax=Burkholderia cepacia TaxID=292 RepID=UPI0038577D6F